MKTKPFDIDKAKAGNPVCTRDLRPARIICYDQRDGLGNEYLTVLVSDADGYEMAYTYRKDGTFGVDDNRRNFDLMLVSSEHTAWINIYKYQGKSFFESGRCTYESEEEAKRHAHDGFQCTYIDTVKITWYD